MGKKKTAKGAKRYGGGGILGLYSNLAYKRKLKQDRKSRRKAEELAQLPKSTIPRFFARLNPKRVFRYWFSKEGAIRFAKIVAACFLIGVIMLGGLFLYYKKDLAKINPAELENRVSKTVNTYLDRSGEVLWEDRGNGDYRLVVKDKEMSDYMRKATVAIEDKNFYDHIGVDFVAMLRATLSTLTRRSVQGGSTLTQQLVKQVYFSEEAKNRSLSGIPRKIKEAILSIEAEKMYSKEQIITMYLNESPYGGRRNGVESAARTYFGKGAKDLTLAESALLAAIPNNPATLNPYNTYGNKALIARQHKVLDMMQKMGYISAKEAKEAKNFAILDTIKPEADSYNDAKAPWFVLEVKSQLEKKFGVKTMRTGGFTIKTTLDLRAQKIAEEAVATGTKSFSANRSDNLALTSVDVESGQVIAMVGSSGWEKEGFGQLNAATANLEPASSIKPILDYTPLFMEREGVNYAPGSILPDTNMDAIYCAGNRGKCSLRNASKKFYGNIPIRKSLAGSLNIPAVKALHINGIDKSLKIARKLGDKSLCKGAKYAGLSAAIGGGCTVKPVEHANAYASLARGGVYKDLAYWTEVRNSSGEIIDSWKDSKGERVVDEQTAYMTTSILADANARSFVFGGMATQPGFYSGKTWFAAKTGTTENGGGKAKDSWIMTYSPVVATAIWNGNHNGSVLSSGSHTVAFRTSAAYIDRIHAEVYGKDGKWRSGDKIEQPSGMTRMSINGVNDIWPSWFSKKNAKPIGETTKKIFDSISKKLATDCTPEETRIEVEVIKTIDPVTNKESYYAAGYDANSQDDIHQCGESRPYISTPTISAVGGNYQIHVQFVAPNNKLASYEIKVNGTIIGSGGLSGNEATASTSVNPSGQLIEILVTDVEGYRTTWVSKDLKL